MTGSPDPRRGPTPVPAEQRRSTRWYRRYDAKGECAGSLWRALRASQSPATIEELHKLSNAHPNQILMRLNRWRECGLVAAEPKEPARYRIVPEAAALMTPPFPGTLAEKAWAALVAIGHAATFEEILAKSGCADRPLYCRLRRWQRRGFVEKVEARPHRYALTPAAPDQDAPPQLDENGQLLPPRRSSAAKLWQVMRVLKIFDIPALMMAAEVKRRACDEFLNLLLRAGYAKVSYRFRKVGDYSIQDWSQYRLVQNTGPKHPTFSKFRKDAPRYLYDHNNGAKIELALRVPASAKESNHVR